MRLVVQVRITNPKTRESRLFKSRRQDVLNSAGAIIRAYIMYKPYVIFTFLAAYFGIISDHIRTNRMLIEDTLEHTKKMRFGTGELLSQAHELSTRFADALRHYERPWR